MSFYKYMRNKILSIICTDEKYARKLGVEIGENCYIATRFFGSEPYLIKIGNHVQITNNVRFFTHGGVWVFREKNPEFDVFGRIVVGNNVYIGNCALIMPGVTIGDNVIVGAGAVVTKSVRSGDIVAGNPAKVVGDVSALEKRMKKFNLKAKGMGEKEKKACVLSAKPESMISKPYMDIL